MHADQLIDRFRDHPDATETEVLQVIRTGDLMQALTLCLTLKEGGYPGVAERCLRRLQSAHLEEPSVSFELGVLLARHDPQQAQAAFKRALQLAPDYLAAFRGLALQHIAAGQDSELHKLLERAVINGNIPLPSVIEVARFHNYLAGLPHSKGLENELYANALDFGVADAVVGDAFSATLAAVRDRRPFTLVRLGDGEGALWRFSTQEELANYAEYWSYRDHFTRRWFGEDYKTVKRRVDAIQRQIADLLPIADIVAAPTRQWIAHEGRSANLSTFVCCVNAARAAHAADRPLARTSIHYDLLDSGGLAQIIDAARRICVVTSHRSLASLMQTRFPNLTDLELIAVPPAFSDLEVTNYSINRRSYDMLNQIVEHADSFDRDYVFLVGAGFVGKLVCLQLKELGFCAIDVGSVFDAVLKYPTRPNFSLYDTSEKFREGVVFVDPKVSSPSGPETIEETIEEVPELTEA